jgi:hypothetical protein
VKSDSGKFNERAGDSMAAVSIKDKNLFKIEEAVTKQIFYGSNQEWYTRRWQRMSGCGPSTVANIIYYLNRTRSSEQYCSNLTKEECLNLMNEIWNFVTPSIHGVSSTDMLCKGVQKYLIDKELDIKLDFIDVPKKKKLRPDLSQVLSFLNGALKKDAPVAFLNLEHGTVIELDSWHWVTMIALEEKSDASDVFAEILDSGEVKKINLSQWFRTTKLGGGFVSFQI